MRATRFGLVFVCVALLASASAALAAKPAGEPFFPRAGDEGYDALAYEVSLGFKPRSGRVKAVTRVEATATKSLRRFSFDFFGPRVRAVEVDGEPAGFSRRPGKLVVTPAAPIAKERASPPSSATAASRRRSPTPTAARRAGTGPATG